MSILIKGMKMPIEGTVIAIYKLNDKFYASVHGTELCPLIEVPPHGRLIDADALESTLNKMGIWGDARVKGFIKSIPTIIPSDKDGET